MNFSAASESLSNWGGEPVAPQVGTRGDLAALRFAIRCKN
jgi:hypothetical protein